jgi:hypothetical protein
VGWWREGWQAFFTHVTKTDLCSSGLLWIPHHAWQRKDAPPKRAVGRPRRVRVRGVQLQNVEAHQLVLGPSPGPPSGQPVPTIISFDAPHTDASITATESPMGRR